MLSPLDHTKPFPSAAGSVSVVKCLGDTLLGLPWPWFVGPGGSSVRSLVSLPFFSGFPYHYPGICIHSGFQCRFQLTPLLLPNHVRVDGRRTLHRLLVVRQPVQSVRPQLPSQLLPLLTLQHVGAVLCVPAHRSPPPCCDNSHSKEKKEEEKSQPPPTTSPFLCVVSVLPFVGLAW